jgi:hypothetical protein
MDAAAPRTVLHHGLARWVVLIWWLATALAALLARNGDGVEPLAMAAGGAVLVAIGWLPGIVLDDDALTIVNPLRTVRLPWSAVTAVRMGWVLTITAGPARYRAWAAPGPRRMSTMWDRHRTPYGVLERDAVARVARASARGDGELGVGEPAMLVSQRWAARAALSPVGQARLHWSPVAAGWLVAAGLLAVAAWLRAQGV